MNDPNSFDIVESVFDSSERAIDVSEALAAGVQPLPSINTPSTTQRIKTPERKKGNAPQSQTSREIETEVDRRNLFCECVDQHLASINRSVCQDDQGVRSSSSFDAAIECVPSMSPPHQVREPEAVLDLTIYDSPLPQRRRLNFNPAEIIDLDDVGRQCCAVNNSIDRCPIGHRNESSADVPQQRHIEQFCTTTLIKRLVRQPDRGVRSHSSLDAAVECVPSMPAPHRHRCPIGHRNECSADVPQQRHIEQSRTTSQQRVDNSSTKTNKASLELQGNALPDRSPQLMCPVCMESTVNRQPTSTICGHIFCSSCISEIIRTRHKCPMCNKKLTNRMIFRIYV